MKAWAFLLLLSAPGVAVANGTAPFCVYSNAPPMCFYHDVQTCQAEARRFNGMCALNQVQQQPQAPQVAPRAPINLPPIQNWNIGESFQRGYEQGQRRRQEREAHEARMRLIEAQIEAMKAEQESVQHAPYLCLDGDRWYESAELGPACVEWTPLDGQ
ncbi:hypothetical protein J2X06_001580 [Lysobacter niastensis]|uniref:DUF4124 domain-containing protein n=1 Tax=Lysobacter niastensis TaxID=380629 RepID=A0ABU1W9R5_9GAMM|nr:hypothetical protein [Lysobacter niastensis]